MFLNLLLDILPDQQYLFTEINIIGNDILIKFKIENPHGIDAAVFELIKSHYTRLLLAERFSANCGDIITELINSILAFKDMLTKEQIKEVTIAKARMDLKKFGSNYWKALVCIALVSSDEFYNYALDQDQ